MHISFISCAEERLVHTERKCVDEKSTRKGLIPELAQLSDNTQLSVMGPLDFVSIRHIQNNLALETEKTCDE